jgi:hypothetical protein
MPNETEDLRSAKADDQPVINMTYNELMDELAAEYPHLPDLQDGDVTKYSMAERTGLTHRHCYSVLEDKVMRGLLQRVYKMGKKGHRIAVYEKITTGL